MNADNARQLDPEGTRASILDAAKAHFVERGYAATSMATIAKEAGVTKSLIHHHFGSKRELWDAVKLRALSDYRNQQSAMLSEYEPDLKLIEDSVLTYFRFLRENPDVVRLVSWMAVEGDEACTDVLAGLTEQGLAVLREGQKRGYLRNDVPVEYMLATFHTLNRGWFTELALFRNFVDDDESVAHEQYLRAILKIYLQGLKPPEEAPAG